MTKYCNFKYPSLSKVQIGSWDPIRPDYFPLIEIDHDFTNPCFKWQYLVLLHGYNPFWSNIIKNPHDQTPLQLLWKHKIDYHKILIDFFKSYYQSSPSYRTSLLSALQNPTDFFTQLQIENPTPSQNFVVQFVARYLNRIIDYIRNSKSIDPSEMQFLFDVQVLNKNFDLYHPIKDPIRLNTRDQSETYEWVGTFPLVGTIPILDLKNQQFRSFLFIARDFLDPPIDWQSMPPLIENIIIKAELHRLWILRETLSQLIENQIATPTLSDSAGNILFSPHINLDLSTIRSFNLIVDTIDHTFSLDSLKPVPDFRIMTGQAAIIHNLLYSNNPEEIKRISQCAARRSDPYFCPLANTQGCRMLLNRNLATFPRDQSERNVKKLCRLLRDEEVFKHELYYQICEYFPSAPFDLSETGNFWVGNLEVTDNRLYFTPSDSSWNPPEISNRIFELVFLSPFCYEKGYIVQFESLIDNQYRLRLAFNPHNFLLYPFQNRRIPCIIGHFSLKDDIGLLRRQKKALTWSIHFQRPNVERNPNEILLKRLQSKPKRIGESSFGQYSRFV